MTGVIDVNGGKVQDTPWWSIRPPESSSDFLPAVLAS